MVHGEEAAWESSLTGIEKNLDRIDRAVDAILILLDRRARPRDRRPEPN